MRHGDAAQIPPGWEHLPAETVRAWSKAAADLTITDAGGVTDVFLWEHTARVVASIPTILGVPEIPSEELDRSALFAAALYHDAGWAIQVRDGEANRWDVLSRPLDDLRRDLAASLVVERLGDCLSAGSLERAVATIRQVNQRGTSVIEARVLSDAENLDEFGPLAFWQLVRQKSANGRAIEACIDFWHSQQEYHFWQARLEWFHFEPVRRLAEKRLGLLEQFIARVREQSRGEDLATLHPSGGKGVRQPR